MPARYFILLCEILSEQGIDPQIMLKAAAIEAAELHARDAMLTIGQMDRLICAAQQLSGRDDLGFELGRRVKTNSHDLLGYGLLSCANLDEFFVMASRHYHLMTETWTMSYRRWHSGGETLYVPAAPMAAEAVQFYLEGLTLAHQNQIALLLGPNAPGYDVYISMKPPRHLQRYLALSSARFHFNDSLPLGIRVVMGADLLNYPLKFSNPAVVRQIDDQCHALAKRPTKSDISWVDYVVMLMKKTNGEQITLEDLARQIKVSPRTIDRHLKKEGLGFRELSNKVRFERASEMLCREGLSVAEVANKLGFSDTANFSRAFRREMGVSPSEYQKGTALPG